MASLFMNVRISWKLFINSLIFLLPTLVLFYFFLSGVDASIQFNSLEILGNEFQAPLENLLQNMYEYENLALEGSSKKVKTLEETIEANLAEYTRLEEKAGNKLRMASYSGAKAQDLYKAWEQIKDQKNLRAADLFTASLSGLISYIGNTSNLILDPDLDSYYLMDVTLLAIPQSQNRLRNLRNFATTVLASGELSADDRLRFAVYGALLEESDFKRVVSSTETAISEDANFYGLNETLQADLRLALRNYQKPQETLIKTLKNLANPQYPVPAMERFKRECDEAQAAALQYWQLCRGFLDELLTVRVQHYSNTRVLGIIATLAAVLLAALLAFFIVRGVSKSMKKTLSFASELSKGNLLVQAELDQEDEIGTLGKNLEALRANLFNIMKNEIRSTVQVISDSLVHLSSSSQEISSSSNQQAAAVKEIVSTMEDSDHLSKGIAQKIDHVTELAQATRSKVDDGFSIITSNKEAMEDIKISSDQTLDGIKSLSLKIENIHNIVNIINSIASQTKIIAFNAELEASSAGEAGKNFEIVATEIRRLADKSGNSTGEIRDIIGEIQEAAQNLMEYSRQGTRKVDQGIDLSSRLEVLFRDIRGAADLSAGSASQIATLIQQQVQAFEQILITLRQISQGIDSFVASVKSSRQSSEDLRHQAGELEAILDKFRLDAEESIEEV